ncbi:kinase-like domain-containing protein [Mycena floridula]|nr:kinase-like domain-containing protein [Mycena floridula]
MSRYGRIYGTLFSAKKDRPRGLIDVVVSLPLQTIRSRSPLSSDMLHLTRGLLGDPMNSLRRFEYSNPLVRMVRTPEGYDVVIRVISIKEEGSDHLKILRRIARGPMSLISIGATMLGAYGFWAQNSVGDVIDMVMQALEALSFLHSQKIAHRDAFHDNFLVQWHPESMLTSKAPISRPRVYIIDFEAAIEFPEETLEADCLSRGPPLGDSFSQPEMYSRPVPPEVETGAPYSPFKLDVWQLGCSISEFRSTIPAIDDILHEMLEPDPVSRMTCSAVLDRLTSVVHGMHPSALLIHPVMVQPAFEAIPPSMT